MKTEIEHRPASGMFVALTDRVESGFLTYRIGNNIFTQLEVNVEKGFRGIGIDKDLEQTARKYSEQAGYEYRIEENYAATHPDLKIGKTI